jgi:cytochrome b
MDAQDPLPRRRFARVWDVPVRLFHWLLVVLIACSWWTGEHHEMDWHRRSGYSILGLLIFRIYLGLVGSATARFSHFVRGPRAVWTYLRSLGGRPYRAAPGHNPAGGWSVVLMLATLTAMVTAGLFSVDVDGLESGPLADYVSFDTGRAAAGIHHTVFNILLALIAFHVAAILFYLVRLRHDLISPMLHGRIRSSGNEAADAAPAPIWKAVLGAIIAGACTYVIATGFRFAL